MEEETLREVYVPKYFQKKHISEIHLIKSPEIYFFKAINVEIISESSLLLKDNLALNDMFCPKNEQRYDLRFGSILSFGKSGKVAIRFNNIEKEKIDKGIFLGGFGSFNYYHFTVDLMSKFFYINNCNKFPNYPILVDEIAFEIPQFKDLLFLLNQGNREIFTLKKSTKYLVSEIIYISDVSLMPINVLGRSNLDLEDFRVSKKSLQYLNTVLNKNNSITSSIKPHKIFISRNSRFLQRLENQKDISSLFEKYGFKIVNTEELSLVEQVQLFANAEIIVGVTGAALTNIIYCKPGTTFVSIIPMKYSFSMYSTIAHHLGIHSIFLDAEIVKKGEKTSGDTYKLDLEYCEKFLIEYKNNKFNNGEF